MVFKKGNLNHWKKLGFEHPLKGKHHSDETKEKMRQKVIEKGGYAGKNNPMYGKYHTEETKKKISIINMGKIGWNKGIPCSNETKERLSKSIKKHSEEYSKRMKNNNPMFNKEIVEKVTNSNKKNGSYKMHSKRMLEGGAIKAMLGNNPKPNHPEKIIINLIKENDLPFNYVGNKQIIIGGFNPDFLSKNPKHIIEVNGDYWHNLPNTKEKDKRKLETYSKYGYKTLVIWEHELKNPTQVLNKIREFIN